MIAGSCRYISKGDDFRGRGVEALINPSARQLRTQRVTVERWHFADVQSRGMVILRRSDDCMEDNSDGCWDWNYMFNDRPRSSPEFPKI